VNDDWLAVLDASDAASKVNAITALTATNADAIQFDDANHTAVAFAQPSPPALPITIALGGHAETYVAGLSASTNYKVIRSGAALTIAADDGTQRLTSTEAGVLRVSDQ